MKHPIFLFFLAQVFLSISSVFGQSTPEAVNSEDSTPYKEKVYLHLDKSYYSTGENVWFKAYRVNASTHYQEDMMGVVYVDLIASNGAVMASRIVKIGKGYGQGDFTLPRDLERGEYVVRAYTSYMRNFEDAFFFKKKIYIEPLPVIQSEKDKAPNKATATAVKDVSKNPVITRKPDLQFFPEGGHMVNSFLNHIGFKALDPSGKSMVLSGDIVANTGEKIKEFTTSNFGMGRFSFIPQPGKYYSAHITYNGEKFTYKLPEALSTGALIQVLDLRDKYQVNIQTSDSKGLTGFVLEASQRIGRVFNAELTENRKTAIVRIPKDELGIGVVQFTLLDKKGVPQCERLVFNDKEIALTNVHIKPLAGSYEKAATAELMVTADLPDLKEEDFSADMSVSVTEVAVAEPANNRLDIRTYLLLNSDLRGEIEQPGYYFYSKDPKRKQHLDLLLMTQGWRQFIVDARPVANDYPYERGITIAGEVRERPKGKTVSGANVSLTYWDESGIGKDKVITDGAGNFKFLSLDFIDKSGLVIEAKDYKRNSRNLFVALDSVPPAPVTTTFFDTNYTANLEYDSYMEQAEERTRINATFANQKGLIELEEVEVVTRLDEKLSIRKEENALYQTATHSLDLRNGVGASFPRLVDALQGRFPNVEITENGIYLIRGFQTINGDPDPLYLIDGVIVNFEEIKFLSPWDVDFVDLLKGGAGTIYGSRGMNGVVLVYTKKGRNVQKSTVIKNPHSFSHSGYYPSRKFYEPKFGSDAGILDPDRMYSTTLYWEPTVLLDESGKAMISFPTGTKAGTYAVILQGLLKDGTPIVSETVFEVD
mgnify:CR=1 FL=1